MLASSQSLKCYDPFEVPLIKSMHQDHIQAPRFSTILMNYHTIVAASRFPYFTRALVAEDQQLVNRQDFSTG